MKLLLPILLSLFLLSCSDSNCIKLKDGVQTELKNQDLVCIDGTEYNFIAMDQRCPCNTDCIWAGEFILNFENTDGVNIFTFHEKDTMSNVDPPFADSFRIVDVENEGDCGNEDNIDDYSFFVQIN